MPLKGITRSSNPELSIEPYPSLQTLLWLALNSIGASMLVTDTTQQS